MRGSASSRRYARALFQLARETNATTEVRRELGELASLFAENKPLRDALLTPRFRASERKSVLTAIARQGGLSQTVAHFLQFLIDQRRLVHFEAIHEEFERLANEASGLVTAHVRAASELDERKQDRLRRALSQRTGREVRLDIRVDPSLVGGAIATVGDMVFDGSVRTQLGRLRSTLTKGS
ncbi:MAG: ATP synthase F1 subunit delta [Myxococcota bacterium]|nr:F0F1 ATP synthase subunit delta [Myxococcales bacterium]